MTLRIHPTFAPVVLNLIKGDAFTEVFAMEQADGTPTNLTGTEWALSIRAALSDDEVIGTTPTVSGNASKGLLVVELTASQTDELTTDRHWFFYLRELNNERTIADGPVRVFEAGRSPQTPYRHRSMKIH
jgi:hypothetical protein